jgi:hypothetical protein
MGEPERGGAGHNCVAADGNAGKVSSEGVRELDDGLEGRLRWDFSVVEEMAGPDDEVSQCGG